MANRNQKSTNLKTINATLPDYLNNEVVPTNSFILDVLLNKGVDISSSIQIVGESGTGKSTIALCIAHSFCLQGKNVVYLDTESSISTEMINNIGMDEFMKPECRRFYYLRLSTFNEAEKKLDEFISTNEISLIIVDSLAGLLNEGYINGDLSITDVSPVYNSIPLGKFMIKYKAIAGKKKIAFIYTNQYRNRIDMKGIGTQMKEYGGKNVRSNSDILLKIGTCKDSEFKKISEAYANALKRGVAEEFEIVKSNKNDPKKFPFYLVYGKGISDYCTIIYALRKLDVLKLNGTYFSLIVKGQEIKANGLENFMRNITDSIVEIYAEYKEVIDKFYDNTQVI